MKSNDLLNNEETFPNRSAFTVGRTVGILLLLQLIAALTLPFILAKPITVGSPAFLTTGSEHSNQIRLAILVSFVGSGFTIYLGIAAFQVFLIRSRAAALLFLVVCIVSCTLDLVHAGTIMSMLSVSNHFVTSGAADSEIYKIAGTVVASARRSAHATQLLGIGAWMLTFYVLMLRFKLIPFLLALTGLIGVTLQFMGVTLMMFLGYPTIGEMAMPLLPIQITVAIWLISKRFNDRIPASSSGSETKD